MSLIAIIIYEIVYSILYFGLLFSKTTLLTYCNNPSIPVKAVFLLLIFSGFFVPYIFTSLKVRLLKVHYLAFLALLCCLYAVGERYYYALQRSEKNFHSFLQVHPTDQNVAIPKPEGVYRIVCLGGSTTEGHKSQTPYPQQLESMLHEKYPHNKIEVLNAGKYFYTTQHSIIQYLFYLKDLNPDLIIAFHAINYIFPSFLLPPFAAPPFRKDYGHYYGALAYVRFPVSFEQFLLGFFYADLRRVKVKPSSFSDLKSLPSFQRNLETMIEIAKCRNITLILSDQAHCFSKKNEGDPETLLITTDFLVDKEHYADEKSWHDAMDLFNKTTKDAAEKFSVPFVNQSQALNGEKEFFLPDAVHKTSEGNRLTARLFFDKIVALGLIKGTEAPSVK